MQNKDDRLAITHLAEEQGSYMNAVVPPVFMNSLHVFDSMESYALHQENQAYVYGRAANPTVHILEEKVAALERGCTELHFPAVWRQRRQQCWQSAVPAVM